MAGRNRAQAASRGGRGGGNSDINSLLSLDGVDADTGLIPDGPNDIIGGNDDILAPRHVADNESDSLTDDEIGQAVLSDIGADDDQPPAPPRGKQPAQRQQQQPPRQVDDIAEDILTGRAGQRQQQQQQPPRQDAQQILDTLLRDPDIRQTIELKGQGKRFRIATDDQQQPPADQAPDFSTMTQAEIVAHIQKSNQQAIAAAVGDVETRLTGRLAAREQLDARSKFKNDLKQVFTDHPDAKLLQSEIGDVLQRYGSTGMTAEEMYHLARAKKVGKEGTRPAQQQRQLASERPSGTSARPPANVTRQRPIAANGKQGMDDILDEAFAESFDFKSLIQEAMGR